MNKIGNSVFSLHAKLFMGYLKNESNECPKLVIIIDV
jgi:hypothetical protein